MESSTVIELVASIVGGGGILYLVIEKLFSRKQDLASAEHTKVETAGDAIPLYKEIRAIVKEELDPVRAELEDIKANWCCYREECEMRLRTPYHRHDHGQSEQKLQH